jgi:trans-2,3-dihydro-3-hydroxyanthranilate isomerase
VLGTAFFVHDRDGVEAVRLLTGAGPIDVVVSDGYGEMSQPLPTWRAFPDPQAVLDAVGVSESALPIEVYDNGVRHAYVAVDDVATLSALKPDHNAVAKLGPLGINCFALTGPASARTRMFGVALGVVEDPATGSAAGPLAVHLARHGKLGFGETVTVTQGVEIGRPSKLFATAYGSPQGLERVAVGGAAVLVARGEYNLG